MMASGKRATGGNIRGESTHGGAGQYWMDAARAVTEITVARTETIVVLYLG